jgi:hypothetical protein
MKGQSLACTHLSVAQDSNLILNLNDRPPEELCMTVVETLEPLLESGEASSSGTQQEAPVTPEVGRLFDEFFILASEIEKNLATSGE